MLRPNIPAPADSERPTGYADRVGAVYASLVHADHRKNQGLYLTPVPIADLMASMIGVRGTNVRILDPGAGAGVLLCAAAEFLTTRPDAPTSLELTAYETDTGLAEALRNVLAYLSEMAKPRGVRVDYQVLARDFVLDHAEALDRMTERLDLIGMHREFDAIIANPPYFKLNKANDPRAKAAAAIIHGQPNIYGLFMAVSAALLRPGGDLVYIVPRSFASGPYFRRFREVFFRAIRPDAAHLFQSRRDAFRRDEVLQETLVFHGTRDDGWEDRQAGQVVVLTSSEGIGDLDTPRRRTFAAPALLSPKDPDRVLRLPSTLAEEVAFDRVSRWPGSLISYGLRISTGPVVPFRAREVLAREGDANTVPLLWMNHVRAMNARWPVATRHPQHLRAGPASKHILLPNETYVILRRFSAKEEPRRLTAAPWLAGTGGTRLLGLENHLNYIWRPGGTLSEDEAYGLAALLNTRLLDDYFRAVGGNTQVSATEIRATPLPPLAAIVAVGRRVRTRSTPVKDLDPVVDAALPTGETSVAKDGREEGRRGTGDPGGPGPAETAAE